MKRIPAREIETTTNTKPTSINLSKELVDKIDAECKRVDMNRSKLISEILKMYFDLEVE